MVWTVLGEMELAAVRLSDNLEALTKTTKPDSVYISWFRVEEKNILSFKEMHPSEDLFCYKLGLSTYRDDLDRD